jgi:hypothetical protein
MVVPIFAIHVGFSKITTLVLENLTVHGQYLGEQTNLYLLIELICRIAIDKHPLASSMRVQIQKPKVFAFMVIVHDDLLNRINGGMVFAGRVDVASVQVHTVRIHTVVPSSHSVRVQNRQNVKHKFIAQDT